MATITLKSFVTPREFRTLTGWSVYKMSHASGIPLYSLYNYMKSEDDPKYREPKPFINRLFAILYQLHQAQLVTD
jgi:hypothetical protein